MTDYELWEAIRENDERAFAKLFYRYSTKLYSKAYSYLRDKAACEQIVHDLFMGLWNGRHTLQIQFFSAYLGSASRYQIYKHMYAEKLPVQYKESLEVDHLSTEMAYNNGYIKMAGEDMETKVDTYLSELPKRCQEIYNLSRRQQLSNDEIADELGISKRTVENQITSALKHLRFSLKDLLA